MRTPRVFTISATTPFLPTLAQALLDGVLIPGFAPRNDPLLLASATVYLPTRRATRAFGDALLNALGVNAALLPRTPSPLPTLPVFLNVRPRCRRRHGGSRSPNSSVSSRF
jgi:inactivated superfamily I helicase